ncbi:ABC transporter ATP-binding protein [uncultured Veillonella sp.]|uniref:ABC transporter ATP-binding protein n=1 Tax=uncultured Veillonella sp. TaxID=159268 RepID=UPI002602A610|nr:ABC transporter ATP-binding protein [uncultured Veillonella sp.]
MGVKLEHHINETQFAFDTQNSSETQNSSDVPKSSEAPKSSEFQFSSETAVSCIDLENVAVSFASKDVLESISWSIKQGSITTLIGPNGCGKSTLLKCIMGSCKMKTGQIFIKGKSLDQYAPNDLAKLIAFLPQAPEIPQDMVVEELVYCGRFPHQNWWRNSAREDRIAVERALQATKTFHLKDQLINSLSGGERQRVWIAMALAQESEILLLDEPTTYLDINHQLEVLDLLKRLNREQGLTVIMVLHELNQAAAYSHEVGVLHKGHLAAVGNPKRVFTPELLEAVFAVKSHISCELGTPYIKIEGLLK